MIRVLVVGAAGRMGRRLVSLISEDDELELAGAIEAAGSPFLGQDAGVVAGGPAQGIAISSDLAAVAGRADVMIDFSVRDGARERLQTALAAGCNCVLGVTGFTEAEQAELKAAVPTGGKLVFAPNFSVGVNLLFALCERAAKILGAEWDIEVLEMHHNQKVDAPSGTAARLGEILAAARGLDYPAAARHGRQGPVGKRPKDEIGMHALRGGDVVGDHSVILAAAGERLELTHRAASRDTFARGALRAVKFLAAAAPGVYDMQQVLGLN